MKRSSGASRKQVRQHRRDQRVKRTRERVALKRQKS